VDWAIWFQKAIKPLFNPHSPSLLPLLRALRAQGRPAAVPLPPELVPGLARMGAQGLLNGAVLPLLQGWELPYGLRRQLDPADPGYQMPGHGLALVNTSYRNWTTVGLPGVAPEAIVDPCGLVTPWRDGWSLDCWVQPAGGPLLVPAAQPASARRQRLQDRLPVVVSAFEAAALRLSTEVWAFQWRDLAGAAGGSPPGGRVAWLAMQAVVFNSSEEPLRGRFYFAVRPFNPEGLAPITRLAYIDQAFVVNGALGVVCLPAPSAWDMATGAAGDLARRLPALTGRRAAAGPQGLVHGVAAYDFTIAPWEEAEFLAFCPLGPHLGPLPPGEGGSRPGDAQSKIQNPKSKISYGRLKGRVTRAWQARLGAGMQLRLPDARLEESWEASKAHLLALHDGDSITPGPALYHSFWLRDAAYMLAALAAAGYGAAAWQVLATYPRRQAGDGAFRGPSGEWDATGQALWTAGAVHALAPDLAAMRRLYSALERGGRWIMRLRRTTPNGLLPPSLSAQHLGFSDQYYWDSFWGVGGLRALAGLAAALGQGAAAAHWAAAARTMLAAIERSLARDAARLGSAAIPAAPGRGLDAAIVGSLAAWYPLRLFSPGDPRLGATLAALRADHFHEGAFFQPIHFGGWGTYLNMHIAQCLVQRRDLAAWDLVAWLLRHASPTYAWPEAIHPRSGGGAYGDGAHGWASADWLLLLRNGCLAEEGDRLVLGAGWPGAWFATPGEIAARAAPTAHGPLDLTLTWTGAEAVALRLAPTTPPPGGYDLRLPFPVARVIVDGAPLAAGAIPANTPGLHIPPSAREVIVYRI
jgi:hypothetical protein